MKQFWFPLGRTYYSLVSRKKKARKGWGKKRGTKASPKTVAGIFAPDEDRTNPGGGNGRKNGGKKNGRGATGLFFPRPQKKKLSTRAFGEKNWVKKKDLQDSRYRCMPELKPRQNRPSKPEDDQGKEKCSRGRKTLN